MTGMRNDQAEAESEDEYRDDQAFEAGDEAKHEEIGDALPQPG
jgi:hypothetical protein